MTTLFLQSQIQKQHFTVVKHAKLIKQCLLFLVQKDEKNYADFVEKTLRWVGMHRVSECAINKLICLSEQFKNG